MCTTRSDAEMERKGAQATAMQPAQNQAVWQDPTSAEKQQ